MAKVTSKLQLTLPKAIADKYGIKPGDQLEWVPAGNLLLVVPALTLARPVPARSVEERLALFRKATARQRRREAKSRRAVRPYYVMERPAKPHEIKRGWRREDLYQRGGLR